MRAVEHDEASMWCGIRVLGFATALLPGQQQGADEEYRQQLAAADKSLLRGELLVAQRKYDEVFEFLLEDDAAEDSPYRIQAEVGIQRIELRRGNYEKAKKSLLRLPASAQADLELAQLLAEIEFRLGNYDVAIGQLEGLVQRDPSDRWLRHRLGCMLDAAGQRARARTTWQANADLEAEATDGLQLAGVGQSLFRLGGRRNYELASRVLVASMNAAPERPEARTTYGLLNFVAYGEASGFPSGEKSLKKVLTENGENEDALLAMYRVRSANMILDGKKTEDFLNRVLDRNPRCVEALVLRAANVLDMRRFEEAAQRLDKALAIDRNHRIALCHRAAAAQMLHDDAGYASFRERALAGDPGWPECDRIVGEHLLALYRFADAVPFFEAALAVDDKHVPSMHGLAKALVYVGEGRRAKELLTKAKELDGGLVDPWRNNAIAVQELLEEQYEVVEKDGFRLLLHQDDREVLRTYLLPIHLEAVEVLGKKYGWQPEEKTTVEVFHTWDDFSVRTIGFRGFTALGACFGRLITLVSPVDGDLRKQDFMWEATAWHEYTHVLTLGVSSNRVPRWLTEGFSVYEERARDGSWERGMQRDLLDAFHSDDIPPVRLMNRLFRGPRILFGYYQGGLIVEFIAQTYGFDKALELLRGFGDDQGIEQVFQRALGMSSRKFDRIFLEHVENKLLRGMRLVPRYGPKAVRAFELAARRDADDLDVRMKLAWSGLQRQNPVDAGRWLAEVLRRKPDHAGAQLARAELLRRRGDLEAAAELFQRGFAAGADDFDSRIRFAMLLQKLDRVDEAIGQYQRAKACWPACTEQENAPELRLARIYRDQGETTQAQMEMKSYVRRTARAFSPRWQLAQFERDGDNRSEELRLLKECNRIDPFYRELHVRTGEALEALGRKAEAALELEVAAAVLPQADRAYLARGATAPAADAPEEREARGKLWLRAAELRHAIGDVAKRDSLIERLLQDASGTGAADDARALQQEWRR
ncbi:MAG: hypothetical protein AB8H80_21845 [Planctomycetota bacterium]